MNKNLKTAKDLVEIARELVSGKEENADEVIAGKTFMAMPLVTTYKGVNVYLNGNDHRPPHLVTTLEEYKAKKSAHDQDNGKKASVVTALKPVDLSKPWSRDNDYDELTEVQKVVANDDYTLNVVFKDGSKKVYDVREKIFDKGNREYQWFKRLQDIDEFKKVKSCGWAVRWDDDTDISSYELYVNGVAK